MDPGVGCHGFIANPTGNIWSKYECFLISGKRYGLPGNFDTEIPHFEDVLDFLTSSMDPGSDIME